MDGSSDSFKSAPVACSSSCRDSAVIGRECPYECLDHEEAGRVLPSSPPKYDVACRS
jgi:hypothetical protein